MLDVVHQEYIQTARAKGVPEYSVIWKHAFRNAALPLINGAGIMFGALLGGAVIIEAVFSLPGYRQPDCYSHSAARSAAGHGLYDLFVRTVYVYYPGY